MVGTIFLGTGQPLEGNTGFHLITQIMAAFRTVSVARAVVLIQGRSVRFCFD